MCDPNVGVIFRENKNNLVYKERDFLIKVLEDIKEFGYENSGCGYSCAKMAEKALEKLIRRRNE